MSAAYGSWWRSLAGRTGTSRGSDKQSPASGKAIYAHSDGAAANLGAVHDLCGCLRVVWGGVPYCAKAPASMRQFVHLECVETGLLVMISIATCTLCWIGCRTKAQCVYIY